MGKDGGGDTPAREGAAAAADSHASVAAGTTATDPDPDPATNGEPAETSNSTICSSAMLARGPFQQQEWLQKQWVHGALGTLAGTGEGNSGSLSLAW